MQSTKSYDYSGRPEVRQIYEEFMDLHDDVLIISDLEPAIKNSGVADKCQLLIKKLESFEHEDIHLEEFQQLFNFDITNQLNQEIIFQILSNGKEKITLQDLKDINKRYGIGLSDADLQTMITYTDPQKKDVPVTFDMFKKLIKE